MLYHFAAQYGLRPLSGTNTRPRIITRIKYLSYEIGPDSEVSNDTAGSNCSRHNNKVAINKENQEIDKDLRCLVEFKVFFYKPVADLLKISAPAFVFGN
jgi:hypothetical protein